MACLVRANKAAWWMEQEQVIPYATLHSTHGAVCPGQNDEMMNQGNLPGQRRGRTRAMGDELAHILCRVRYHDATHLLAACSRQAERYCTVLYVVSIFLSSAHGSFSLSLGRGAWAM